MTIDYCVISIGTLSRNRLWGERVAVRTSHATTTLIRQGERVILVDPSLPGTALAARLNERTGLGVSDVTDVFCTTLRPVHRRSIGTFAKARWWAGDEELQTYQTHLEGVLDSAQRLHGEDAKLAEADLGLIKRFRPAPERFSEQVQLYPLAGPSLGSAGLLLISPTLTTIVAGDAGITCEHVRRGQVFQGCADTHAALQSLCDLVELADVIVPGHDNVMFSPRRWL